jgi:formylglycine-generating enzyme required for sulfatase activity
MIEAVVGRRSRRLVAGFAIACVGCASPPARPPTTAGSADPALETSPQPVSVPALAPGELCPSGMVQVPGGAFLRREGAPPSRIAALCVDITEVTVDAYEKCVEQRRCIPAPTEPRGARLVDASCNVSQVSRGKHPINCIDALLASSFCKAAGKRLPDDMEWWWIARGALAARRYPWGDDPAVDQACWSGPRALEGTCGAGGQPEDATLEGVLDLAGNVAEWTTIATSTAAGATTAGARSYRVHGGSFASRDPSELVPEATCAGGNQPQGAVIEAADGGKQLRVGPREICDSDALRSPAVGFRCVRDAGPGG